MSILSLNDLYTILEQAKTNVKSKLLKGITEDMFRSLVDMTCISMVMEISILVLDKAQEVTTNVHSDSAN